MTRALCTRCERPASVCLCQDLPQPIETDSELLILQHPSEAAHAKNTAVLLRLGLTRCRVLRGELFDAAEWTGSRQAVLLYPTTQSPNAHSGAAWRPPPAQPGSGCRLILLDGSWRQSRRLLALNPGLAALPRMALPADSPGRYMLRRAHRPGQLSTLEAGLLALQQLEADGDRFAPLWAAFDGFVARGLARAGRPGPAS